MSTSFAHHFTKTAAMPQCGEELAWLAATPTLTHRASHQRSQPDRPSAAVFDVWMRKAEALLGKSNENTRERSIALPHKEEKKSTVKRARSGSPLRQNPRKKCRTKIPERLEEAAPRPVKDTGARPHLFKLKPSLPDPGLFVSKGSGKSVTVIKLTAAQLSWVKQDATQVCLESTRSDKDEDHLTLQTKALFDHFLRAHCTHLPDQVCTPMRLLVRLFQCHCVAAGVPTADVASSVVAQYIQQYCIGKYKCTVKKKATCVVGLVVFRDSPLHAAWRKQAVVPSATNARTKHRDALQSFTKCLLVNPRHAMSGISHFTTDATENTTSKFVVYNVISKLQHSECCKQRELNNLQFGHVMCKGNRGLETTRPQRRIMPPGGGNKQEYHYRGVEPRAAPLKSRGALHAAIEKRGFSLQQPINYHLMRHAQLHASHYSEKLHCHAENNQK